MRLAHMRVVVRIAQGSIACTHGQKDIVSEDCCLSLQEVERQSGRGQTGSLAAQTEFATP